ncbi:MAG TPA: alpha/beta hydrolase [Clostridia bacterium]|nr:alpha/beta hydrolase [Clostridia bacterium]
MINFIISLMLLVLLNYLYQYRLANSIKLSWYEEENLININGNKIHIKIQGQGKPLFFIHGSQMNLYDWRNNIDYFSKFYTVYAVDMIGSGFSDKPKVKYSPKYYADFILQLLDYYNIEKASFIGSSWGGGHVLYFSLLNPERVEKMIMSSPTGYAHKETLLEKILKKYILGEITMLLGNRIIIKKELKSMFTDKTKVSKELINSVFKPIYMKGGIHAVLSAYRNDDFSFVKNNLENISRPVMIIWGRDDIVHSKQAMKQIVERIPNSTFINLENTGHLPHEEKATVFNKFAKDFLESEKQN